VAKALWLFFGRNKMTIRTDKELNDCEDWASQAEEDGSRYPGMTYEQGVLDTLHWMRGDADVGPHQDEA
jgi:hypothetical protein